MEPHNRSNGSINVTFEMDMQVQPNGHDNGPEQAEGWPLNGQLHDIARVQRLIYFILQYVPAVLLL
jgi:hypothetical protein